MTKVQKYPLTKQEFQEIYSRVPRLTVELIIKTSKGIILTKRAIEPYIGMWHIPGGTVWYKETLEESIHRVAHAELGIKVNIEKQLGTIYYPNILRDFGWDTPIGMAFLLSIAEGEPRGSYQGEEIGYFTELPQNVVESQDSFLLNSSVFDF